MPLRGVAGKSRHVEDILVVTIALAHYLLLWSGVLDGSSYLTGLLLPSLFYPALSLVSNGRQRIAHKDTFQRACTQSPRRAVVTLCLFAAIGYVISFFGGVACGDYHNQLLFEFACKENARTYYHLVQVMALYASHCLVMSLLAIRLAKDLAEHTRQPA